jgi:hypothetical protein
MQEPIEGRLLLERKQLKTMLETRVYLERIRNSMHEPIEGLSHGDMHVLFIEGV